MNDSVILDPSSVHSVVSNISKLQDDFSSLSSSIKSATNQIVSARGFNEYIGGLSSDSFSSYVTECGAAVGDLVTTIQQKEISILAFNKDSAAINAFLDTLDRKDYDRLDLSEIDSYISFGRKAGNFFKGLGADIATVGLGLVEGIMDFGETGADLVTLGGTLFASIFTKGYDLLTGSDVTTQMWNETKAKVSEKKVENIFNNFYSDTEIGQSIKNNAYGFDAVRGVSKGLGYTAALIGTNILTGGLASGLGVGASGSITAGQLATTAGVMGFSNGTEEAWADGATTEKGLLYGAATGAWEGAQWYLGAKINQYGGFGDQVAKGIFKGAYAGVGTRIAMDTVDSGLEGFVQPALTMIYKDYGGDSFAENYSKAFEAAGGWANVGTQAAIGAFASAVGEYAGARRLLKANDEATKKASELFKNGGMGDEEVDAARKSIMGDMDADEQGLFGRKKKTGDAGGYKAMTDEEVETARKRLFGNGDTDAKADFFRKGDAVAGGTAAYEHIDRGKQQQIVDEINRRIKQEGHATYHVKSTKDLTSHMLDGVDDLSKLEVRVDGGFVDLDGNFKSQYRKGKYLDRITYNGYEASDIVRRMEGLESRIDMSLPTTERAKQIYEIVSNEYSYSHKSLGSEYGGPSWVDDVIEYTDGTANGKGHRISASLRGMTSNNALGEEGLVCAGYSQVYKELCDRAGVPCDYVSGLAVGDGSSGRHAWNVVLGTNGEQIPVDCTWHSGGGGDWFGASEKFAASHIADSTEIYCNYRPVVQTPQVNSTISHIVNTMDGKNGSGSGNYGLLRYLATGEENSITRTDGARNMLRNLTTSDIENYFKNMDGETRTTSVMSYIKDQLIGRYGKEEGTKQFNAFLSSHDTSYITRSGGARDLANKWLTYEDIVSYILMQ